ncbi:hypothetical protein SAMN04488038_11521 [Solimonas aquatica]|uniref:DUF4136 domain-containing protein n=1 Tax=Solimonas aquatica TaxID=489703 RepID=A0A1H9L5G4_9GAMM|nr:hypothetical protein [Solimonas aquatica]SER06578.1 hypothetical protein SAMN04488038_11521 [Solimonas aquatica]
MRKRFAPAAGLLLSALLSACAAVTPYQPLHDGYGYSAQLIESNRYRVSFAGSSATPRQTVENYMLYQAAELTLRSGSDYFIIAGGGTQSSGSNAPTLSFGFGGFSFGGHGGVGMGVGTSTGGGQQLQYTASADILVFKGKKPDNNPQAFDAREVKANLEAQIQRPPAAAAAP